MSDSHLFNYREKARQGGLRGWAKLFWSSLPEETSGKNNNLSSNKSHRLMPRVPLFLAQLSCIRRWGLRRQTLPVVLPSPAARPAAHIHLNLKSKTAPAIQSARNTPYYRAPIFPSGRLQLQAGARLCQSPWEAGT